MTGYWEAPEATAEVLDADGWFHTGDAARIDEHGELVILGRTRDRISLPNGLNVYPEDVETALVGYGRRAGRGGLRADARPAGRGARAARSGLRRGRSRRRRARRPTPRSRRTRGSEPGDAGPKTTSRGPTRSRSDAEPVKAWYARRIAPARQRATPAPALERHPGRVLRRAGPRSRSRRWPRSCRPCSPRRAAVIAAGHRRARPRWPSLELDSLTVVTLALRLDEAFDAPLSDDEIMSATTSRRCMRWWCSARASRRRRRRRAGPSHGRLGCCVGCSMPPSSAGPSAS